MRLSVGKISKYVGQVKEEDKEAIDDHLVNVDRDLQNIWRVINANLKLIGSQGVALETNSALGFSYIPLIDPNPLASPTSYAGHTAMAFCNSNSSLYIYNTSDTTWKTEQLT